MHGLSRQVVSHGSGLSRQDSLYMFNVQRSLYFKTNHGTMKMWSYIAGGLKLKGCKIEGPLYMYIHIYI